MNVDGTPYRTIWVEEDGSSIRIVDQTRLPHEFVTRALTTVAEAAEAIKFMRVRGAPLIGATAAYGVCLALAEDPSDAFLDEACNMLMATRPTAVNLRWAVDEMKAAVQGLPPGERLDAAYAKASGFPRMMSPLAPASATKVLRSSARLGRGQDSRDPWRFSRIATPAGSPPSTGERPRPDL